MGNHASINRIYRLVWNTALNVWVAVAENARGAGKGGSSRSRVAVRTGVSGGFGLNSACRAALLMLTALLVPQAYAANAADAVVSSGAGSVATSGATTTINQASQNLAIDWSKLSTVAGEALVFNQPNSSAIALNRIIGSSPSELLGSLTANGQVFILNPNGVLFGAGSQVNVGGLVASTLSMSNADFEAGNYKFTGNGGSGSVVNQGTMTAASGGYLALLAPEVRNEGVMTASLGTALLAAGNKVTLNLDNGSLLGYSIDQGAINALAENRQLIKADGGQVLLGAKALDSLTSATVNNTGIIEARTLQNKAGRIMLMGDMETGTVNVGGTLDASAPNGGDGGFIETSAANVKIAAGTHVTTKAGGTNAISGTWLIDPVDFTIAAGSAAQDASGIGADTLSASLESGNVSIATSATTSGNGDIFVNSALSWSAANSLSLSAHRDIQINSAVTAAAGGLTLNAGNVISAPATVNVGTFTLGSGTWSQVDGNLAAFSARDFRISGGTFIRALGGDGLSAGTAYQIADIYGLQGADSSGMLGKKYLLANNIDASGTVNWNSSAGFNSIGDGTTAFTGTFDGNNKTITGLTINRATTSYVGLFGYTSSSAAISNVGLVGGSVIGASHIGGLAGTNEGVISNAYATGSVAGDTNVGGLVGMNRFGTIINAYATGRVLWTGQYVGGLVGRNVSGTITNSYATVSVPTNIGNGGLVGLDGGTSSITNSFWNTDTSGQTTSAGGTGKTSVEMMQAGTFANWSIAASGGTGSVWRIYEGQTGPLLRSFLTARTLTDTVVTYDGAAQTATAAGALITDASGRNAGTYASYSSQQGYDLTGGALVINKANLTLAAVTDSKTYDGTADSTVAVVKTGLVGGDSATVAQSFGSKNVLGTSNSTLAVDTGYTIADGNGGGNYNVTTTTAAGTINKANLTLAAVTDSKTYDGTTTSTAAVSTTGLAGNDNLTALTQSFGSKNVLGTGASALSVDAGYVLNDGNSGGNYNVTVTAASGTINKATLSVTGVVANNKTYNGTDVATLSNIGTLSGLVGAETLALSQTAATFDNKNAGTGKTVTATGYGIADGSGGTGGLASNYQLASTSATTMADIAKANLTLSTSDVTKTYDAGTSAAGTAIVTAGTVFSGDSITGASFAFTDKNFGIGNKTVTTSGAVVGDGVSNANYNVSYTSNTTSTINKATLTISGVAADNKTYDGTNAATLSNVGTLNGLVSGEALTLSQTAATFADKNAGASKTVTASGYGIADGAGGLANNYQLASTTATTTADIAKANLTLSTSDVTKTYDAGTSAAGTAIVTAGTVFSGDSITGAGFAFTDKNAGNGNKTVTASGAVVGDGVNNGNYNVSYANNTTSTINKADLTLTSSGVKKVYDGNTTATMAYADNRVAGDVFAVTGLASFTDKNAGTAKAVNVTGISVSGADAGNYNVVSGTTASTSADITPKALSVVANNDSRRADGTAYSGGNGVSYAGLVGGETAAVLNGTLTYGGSAQGASTAGSYAITPGGYSAANYTISYLNGVLSLSSGGAAEAALGGTALVTAYGGAVQAVAGIGSSLGGTGSSSSGSAGGAGSSGGVSGIDASALAAAAAEAGNTGEEE